VASMRRRRGARDARTLPRGCTTALFPTACSIRTASPDRSQRPGERPSLKDGIDAVLTPAHSLGASATTRMLANVGECVEPGGADAQHLDAALRLAGPRRPVPCHSVTLDIDDTVDLVRGRRQLSPFKALYDDNCRSMSTTPRRAGARSCPSKS